MQLFSPFLLCIQPPEEQHQQRGKLVVLFCRGRLSSSDFVKNLRGLLLSTRSYVTMCESVVRESGTVCVEVVMTALQRIEELLQRADVGVTALLQSADPAI